MTADTAVSDKLREKTRRVLRNRTVLYGLALPLICWVAGSSGLIYDSPSASPAGKITQFITFLYYLSCPLSIIGGLGAGWVLYRRGSFQLALRASFLPAAYMLASIIVGLLAR